MSEDIGDEPVVGVLRLVNESHEGDGWRGSPMRLALVA